MEIDEIKKYIKENVEPELKERFGEVKVGVKIDDSKVGYEITAIVALKIEKGEYKNVEIALSNYKNVLAVYGVSGRYDVFVIAKFKDLKDLNYFLTALAKMNNVKESETFIVLEKGKENVFF